MARSSLRAARYAALLSMAGPIAAPAHAQGALTAYVALKESAQGQIKGDVTIPVYKNEIAAISLTTSQPYGAATPVLHVVTDAAVAPQIVRALVTNEMLQTPTISFAKPGPTGTLQQLYQIRAPRGYVTSVTIAAAAGHAPTVAFDLLLSGGTTSINETGAATTTAPPSILGSAPVRPGVVVDGEFDGMTSGILPPSPNAPMHKGVVLDSVSVTINTPVTNGATGAKALAHPLVIVRPTSEDAAVFDAAQASQEPFTDILLHVYEPQLTGTLADVFDIRTKGACMYVGATPCPSGSGLASSRPGGSAGSSATGGHSGGQTLQPRALPGTRRMNDASTTMLFQIPTIMLENRVTQVTVSYSFVQAKLD